jgi:hypothetical protein
MGGRRLGGIKKHASYFYGSDGANEGGFTGLQLLILFHACQHGIFVLVTPVQPAVVLRSPQPWVVVHTWSGVKTTKVMMQVCLSKERRRLCVQALLLPNVIELGGEKGVREFNIILPDKTRDKSRR